MKFGSCSDCGKYKYLPNVTKCRSCLPDTVWNAGDNTLLIGGIATGKTVTMKQHLIRTLDKTEQKVYVIDPIGAYDDLKSSYKTSEIKINKNSRLDILRNPSFISNHLVVEKMIEESNNTPVSSLLKHRIKKHVNETKKDTFSDIKVRLKNTARAGSSRRKQEKLDRKLRKNIQVFEDTIHDSARNLNLKTDTQFNVINIDVNATSTSMFSIFNAIYMEIQSAENESIVVFDHATKPVNSSYLRLVSKYLNTVPQNVSFSFVTSNLSFLKLADAREFMRQFDTKLCFKVKGTYHSKFYRYENIGKTDKRYLESNMKTGECLLQESQRWKRGSIVLNNREKSIIN